MKNRKKLTCLLGTSFFFVRKNRNVDIATIVKGKKSFLILVMYDERRKNIMAERWWKVTVIDGVEHRQEVYFDEETQRTIEEQIEQEKERENMNFKDFWNATFKA